MGTRPGGRGTTVDGEDTASFYAQIGGEPTFHRLVDAFYQGVAGDPVLRPLYPDSDLGAAAQRLRLFLIQYWGGPRDYQDLRGHPRLRLRHAPFVIGPEERDAWLRHMAAAVATLDLPPQHEATLWEYLSRAAEFMVNVPVPEPGPTGPGLALTPVPSPDPPR